MSPLISIIVHYDQPSKRRFINVTIVTTMTSQLFLVYGGRDANGFRMDLEAGSENLLDRFTTSRDLSTLAKLPEL